MSDSNLKKQEIPALTINQFKDVLKTRFKFRHIKSRPVVFCGHTGVGKTQAPKQCAKELTEEIKKAIESKDTEFLASIGVEADTFDKVQFRVSHLEFLEPPDFMGAYEIDENHITRHARPLVLPKDGYGIWLIDEPNRCRKDNRQALLSLLEDRRANEHKIGKGWVIVLAMNPPDDVYEVDEFDKALEERISYVEFKGSPTETIEYFKRLYTDRHPVVKWMINQPSIIDFKGRMRTNPRSLEYLIKAIAIDNGGVIKPEGNTLNFNTLAMEVGTDGAQTFRQFVSSPDYITAEDVIDGWNKDLEKRIGALGKQNRTDIITALNSGIASVLQHKDEKYLTLRRINNLIGYQQNINMEQLTAFWLELGKAIGEREKYFFKLGKPSLEKNPKIRKFLAENDEAIKRGR